MSSYSSLFSGLHTPASAHHTYDHYINSRLPQARCVGSLRKASTDHTTYQLPLASEPQSSSHVIEARNKSCMQQTAFPTWSPLDEHTFQTNDFDSNLLQAYRVPRSAQSAHQPASAESWFMLSGRSNSSNSMGVLGVSPVDGLKRQNSHQRASSTSTIASNGPASPYNFSSPNPLIVNTDLAPFEQSIDFTKDTYPTQHYQTNPAYLSAGYLPVQAYAKPSGGQTFNDFSFTAYHMSHPDQASSSTPSSVSGELDVRQRTAKAANGEMEPHRKADEGLPSTDLENRPLQNAPVQLSRTESAAYQDELYNPANFMSAHTAPAKPARSHAPQTVQRTLVNQYLESANMARSVSPNSAVSRERSPFREGSELAATDAWSSPRNPIQTAASRRQQIKLQREQAELAAHRPQLQREPTKTISPKDALLDYNESDQAPLIQDVVPAGYKQHLGGSESYADATSALKDPSFNMSIQNQTNKNMASFRAAGDAFTTPNFSFSPPATQITTAMQNPFQMGAYQQLDPSYAAVSLAEPTPQFPATLTSMESSISDQTPAYSSQESSMTSMARPVDTRANAGAYTCTYHGCAQRFDSPVLLQKHKKEYHRVQQQQQQEQQARESLSVEASSESPRSTSSPDPSGSGLTSAQILARNSQAGPHKCARTNPSTGKPCNTVFSRPYDLTRHEETIHNGRKHKVRCPYCREEKTFSRNDALTRHMRVVHPDVENFGKRGRRGE